MPIEPVKIDASRLSEEILESVTCLNNAINQYNNEKNLVNFTIILKNFCAMLNTSKATPKDYAANYGIDVSALVQAFRNEKTNTFITSEDVTPRVELLRLNIKCWKIINSLPGNETQETDTCKKVTKP